MRTRLCLVRHGETDWNVERRLQGHLDVSLNARGRAQALATARALKGHEFDAVYSSDLARANETARAVAAASGLPINTAASLRERHYGDFQGLTYNEAAERHPQAYARFMARDTGFDIPGGGESLDTFSKRIGKALLAIADQHPGRQILIVTHGGVLDIAHRLATNTPLMAERDFAIPNAALNWIVRRDEDWHLEAWAQQGHLGVALDELQNT
ncbi:MAG: histidine phosphatase family protein [Rhodocyclaceae bacterium]|nr:histidine phosphatase family protein [Rhodocyclaceae bacterium]MCP5311582.1 histidine phosphatase family protein [Zoogloeaceae bacterium]